MRETTCKTFLIIFASLCQRVHGNDAQHRNCFDNICLTEDYNRFKAPRTDFVVYANIESAIENVLVRDALKRIDVYQMILTYSPTFVLAWQDPRIKVKNLSGQLDEYLFDHLWIPKITAANRANKKHDLLDRGKSGKYFAPIVELRLVEWGVWGWVQCVGLVHGVTKGGKV